MAEKATFMKLEVDLECQKCFKKVKKVLAKYPQIRDQKFDHKGNIVFITVVCCSPEKIRDKLCSKGGGSIKSIEILEQPKPVEPEKKKKGSEKPKPAEPEKKKEADKPKEKPKEAEKPKPAEPEKKKEGGDKPNDKPPESKPKGEPEKPKDKPAEPKPAPLPVKHPDPVPAYPPVPPPIAVPVGMCVEPYYSGGPRVNGYVGPPVCCEGYYGRPVYDSYGSGTHYNVSRCDQYFSEENPQGCKIM